MTGGTLSYAEIQEAAAGVPVGSDGLSFLPFGNGAERLLGNRNPGARMLGIDFNRHDNAHLYRAVIEGVVFTFRYGIDIMKEVGVQPDVIRAGHANMFLSPIFRSTLANVTGAAIELYDTDGALGAARGAGIGAGFYNSPAEAFSTLEKVQTIEPGSTEQAPVAEAYARWLNELKQIL